MSNKKTKTIYVTKTFVANADTDEQRLDELDLSFKEEHGFDYDDDEMDFERIDVGQGDADGFPIAIDVVIEALTRLKAKGASHVEMDYHCDHIGYDISGYNIRKSTPEEVEVFTSRKLGEQAKQKKLQELYKKIEDIENEK